MASLVDPPQAFATLNTGLALANIADVLSKISSDKSKHLYRDNQGKWSALAEKPTDYKIHELLAAIKEDLENCLTNHHPLATPELQENIFSLNKSISSLALRYIERKTWLSNIAIHLPDSSAKNKIKINTEINNLTNFLEPYVTFLATNPSNIPPVSTSAAQLRRQPSKSKDLNLTGLPPAKVLIHLQENPFLEILTLGDPSITHKDITEWVQSKLLLNLRYLDLRKCNMLSTHDEVQKIFNLLPFLPFLETLLLPQLNGDKPFDLPCKKSPKSALFFWSLQRSLAEYYKDSQLPASIFSQGADKQNPRKIPFCLPLIVNCCSEQAQTPRPSECPQEILESSEFHLMLENETFKYFTFPKLAILKADENVLLTDSALHSMKIPPYLSLSGCPRITNQGIHTLLRKNGETLLNLNLSACPQIDESAFTSLPENALPNLRVLDLRHTSVPYSMKQKIALLAPQASISMHSFFPRAHRFFIPHTDCEIICGDHRIPAHRCILEARCARVDKLIDTKSLECQGKKCTQDLLLLILEFIYTNAIGSITPGQAFDVALFADELGIPNLSSYCLRKIPYAITKENVVDIYQHTHLFFANYREAASILYQCRLFVEHHCHPSLEKAFSKFSKDDREAIWSILKDPLMIPLKEKIPKEPVDPDFSPLLLNPLHSDITFILEGEKIPAHRAILSMRSSYFEHLLTGPFREANLQEVPLQDISAESFKLILTYLYSGKCNATPDQAAALRHLADCWTLFELGELYPANLSTRPCTIL